MYIEAIRTVQRGEELNYDYQIQRDPEDAPNVDEIFACRCGAAKCRGSMLVAPKKKRKGGGRSAARKRAVAKKRSAAKKRPVAKKTSCGHGAPRLA